MQGADADSSAPLRNHPAKGSREMGQDLKREGKNQFLFVFSLRREKLLQCVCLWGLGRRGGVTLSKGGG